MKTVPVLELDNLRTHFRVEGGVNRSVDGVSFEVFAGETLAVVGESGCGKSVTAMSVLGLLPRQSSRHAGQIRFMGRDLLRLSEKEMRSIRGKDISMIFQEPMTSLNPVLTIGHQIAETLKLHENLSSKIARERAIELLTTVGIPEPARRVDEYPHQLSGGMRQRAMIAIALSCSPKLLIADEPTTALDVTVQAQILDLIGRLKERIGAAVVLITHDLGVVAEVADRVVVMYAGKKVEEACVDDLFRDSRHPYTRGLLRAVVRLGSSIDGMATRLNEIPGQVPSLREKVLGCIFADRCPDVQALCRSTDPPVMTVSTGHQVTCHFGDKPERLT